MARTPRARVPKSSGQGVSRLAYQKSYDLGNRGTGGLADFKTSTQDTPKRRSYGKSGETKGINVSYGETYEPTDLTDVEALGKGGSPAKPLPRRPAKRFK